MTLAVLARVAGRRWKTTRIFGFPLLIRSQRPVMRIGSPRERYGIKVSLGSLCLSGHFTAKHSLQLG